jgi:FtsH-binding integral membrane protein
MNLGCLIADTSTRTYYELARLNVLNQWWHWLVLAAVLIGLMAIVYLTYQRDTSGFPRALRWLLTGLRIAAFVGLFVFFLQLEKRIEHKVVKNSRAVILVDTSQSMGLDDVTGADGQSTTRIQQVVETLADQQLVDNLRQQHDVVVYRFDQGDRPAQIASLPRQGNATEQATEQAAINSTAAATAKKLAQVGLAFVGLALVAILLHLFFKAAFTSAEGESWALLVAVFAGIIGAVTLAVGNLRYPEYGLQVAFGEPRLVDTATVDNNGSGPSSPAMVEPTVIDWSEQLKPSGVETRLGDAISYLVEHERGGPLAGIVVVTDGNQNAGIDTRESVASAQAASIQLFPIGAGSPDRPASIRVVDVEAPARVYPADMFTIKTFLQSFGWKGRNVKVQLFSRKPARSNEPAPAETLVDEILAELGNDGEPVPVKFELTPTELGKYEYVVRATAPGNSTIKQRDLEKVASVQVVDRKNKVLLLAGGPTREYRFVRVLCYRDKETIVDVHLQGALPGMAQEADQILEEFPSSPEELFEYDCIVAFDPDWQQLSEEQIELIDRWLSEKAGGMICVAGPVYTPEWTTLTRGRRGIQLVKGFYPVSFFRRSTGQLTRGKNATTQAWPVEFTDAGRQARQLWLDDDGNLSQQRWSDFSGVYSYFPVRAAKPGATVYGSFSNPQTSIDNQLPVYMAGHFYGAGRVFYLGSGEMWRLRAVDPEMFGSFYTKLIRYVSEGRLLRDSSRGLLLVSKDRSILGETIIVRASLTDEQFQPLVQQEVAATLISPNGNRQPFKLQHVSSTGQLDDTSKDGSYSSQFTALQEGDYRIELPIPNSEQLDVLTRTVRVRVPDREVETPQRNDALLNELATATGGVYFPDLNQAASAAAAGLVAALVPQDQETYIPGTPDRAFQQRLMTWLMGLICGALCVEWTIRRLNKLA